MSWDPFLMKILLKKDIYESYEQCTDPQPDLKCASPKIKKPKVDAHGQNAIQTCMQSLLNLNIFFIIKGQDINTIHPQCGGHSTSINTYGVWGVRARVQVSRREFHTYIHLNQTRVEFLSCKKKKIVLMIGSY